MTFLLNIQNWVKNQYIAFILYYFLSFEEQNLKFEKNCVAKGEKVEKLPEFLFGRK